MQYLDSSAAYLTRAVDIALNQLGTTYIDVLMPHAPDPLLVRGSVGSYVLWVWMCGVELVAWGLDSYLLYVCVRMCVRRWRAPN